MGSEKVGGQHDRSLSVVSSLLIHLKLFEAERGGEGDILLRRGGTFDKKVTPVPHPVLDKGLGSFEDDDMLIVWCVVKLY